MHKVLFIGASGMLGNPVARELIRAGFDLTLFGRDLAKLDRQFPNIKKQQGDVFDSDSLKAAMKDQDIVYINLSINKNLRSSEPQPEREGMRNILEAAAASGIKRIGYLSSLIKNYRGMNQFNWWAFDIKHAAVEAIRHSGIPYSVFYPSTFMETIDQQMIRGNRIVLAGKSEYPMWFISGKDFGSQVAWAFKKAGDSNQEYSIQGPEAYTFELAVKIFMSNCKKKFSVVRLPLLPMKIAGLFKPDIQYAARICEALNNYPEKFESQTTWDELGKPLTTLEEYTKKLKL